MDTGWKPMLLYAVAYRGGFAEMVSAWLHVNARSPGEQCSIGFQPVSIRAKHDAFQISSVSVRFGTFYSTWRILTNLYFCVFRRINFAADFSIQSPAKLVTASGTGITHARCLNQAPFHS
jgi:hypothetical protein